MNVDVPTGTNSSPSVSGAKAVENAGARLTASVHGANGTTPSIVTVTGRVAISSPDGSAVPAARILGNRGSPVVTAPVVGPLGLAEVRARLSWIRTVPPVLATT